VAGCTWIGKIVEMIFKAVCGGGRPKKHPAAKRSSVKQATPGCQQISLVHDPSMLVHERIMRMSCRDAEEAMLVHERMMIMFCRDAEEAMLVQAIQASLSGDGDESGAPLANCNHEQVRQNLHLPSPSVILTINGPSLGGLGLLCQTTCGLDI